MPRQPPPELTPELARRIREMVFAAAKRHDIPPVWITAHVRYPAGDAARREVMRAMILELGMRRWQVAKIFQRDRRRLRKSVLGV